MNISYRWLKDLLPGLALRPEELTERLAARGAPVEELVDLSAGIKDVVVARVEEAGQHPNADRLSLCTVNAGGEELLQVVCGAPNVKAGAYYPFAPVGATLPGGLKLKKAKIRGEFSHGMLCSPSEIGLGTDHDGILELEGSPEIGTPLAEALGLEDWRLDVEVTANRGDMLSHVGVAREVLDASQTIQLPAIPDASNLEFGFLRGVNEVVQGGVSIQIDDPDLCSRYLGVVIRGLQVGPSPEWLQTRLRAVDARPINNVVDATNYVLMELGQPTHAFDLNKLADHRIVVRRALENETLTTLDGTKRRLSSEMLAICDGAGATAIAGVMGGEDSEVSAETTDVLLECALFDPPSTRNTRRALGMSTDASYRYERGVDPDTMETAVLRVVELILATAGGTVEGNVLDVHPVRSEVIDLELRTARVTQVLGVEFSRDQIAELVAPLGFVVGDEQGDGVVPVRVPGHRRYDVTREIDLVEEIARAHGFDAFPEALAPFRPTVVPDHPLFELEERLRTLLIHRGAFELQSPAFVPTGEVELPNPVSNTESHLRASMMHGVLRSIEYNLARGTRDVRLFEIGTVFFRPPDAGQKPLEATHLAAAMVGRSSPPHWTGTGSEVIDFWDTKAVVVRIAEMAWPGAEVRPSDGTGRPAWMAPGPALEVWAGDQCVGWAGTVADSAVDTPPWAGDVFGVEVGLPADPSPVEVPVYRPIPAYPGIERDLALLVPPGVAASQVLDVIRARGGALLEGVDVFDVYTGEGIAEGERSLAYRLTFRSAERTLTDDDVEPGVRRVLKRLKEELNVHQRG